MEKLQYLQNRLADFDDIFCKMTHITHTFASVQKIKFQKNTRWQMTPI